MSWEDVVSWEDVSWEDVVKGEDVVSGQDVVHWEDGLSSPSAWSVLPLRRDVILLLQFHATVSSTLPCLMCAHRS